MNNNDLLFLRTITDESTNKTKEHYYHCLLLQRFRLPLHLVVDQKTIHLRRNLMPPKEMKNSTCQGICTSISIHTIQIEISQFGDDSSMENDGI